MLGCHAVKLLLYQLKPIASWLCMVLTRGVCLNFATLNHCISICKTNMRCTAATPSLCLPWEMRSNFNGFKFARSRTIGFAVVAHSNFAILNEWQENREQPIEHKTEDIPTCIYVACTLLIYCNCYSKHYSVSSMNISRNSELYS